MSDKVTASATFSPDQQFEDLKQGVARTLQSLFPFEGKRSKLVLHGVEVRDEKDSKDVRSQQEAIKKSRSWDVPVYGDMSLIREGEEIDRKKVLMMHLPKTTDRFGYIVGGNEYQILNQFRLKSGVYHRAHPNGDLLAEYNLANSDQFAKGRSFKLRLDPEKAIFYFKHGESNIPLYPLLKELGVTDDTLEAAWGKEILEKNQAKSTKQGAFRALMKSMTGNSPKEITDEHVQLFKDSLAKTKLLGETTEKTLGKAFTSATPESMTRATKNLLGISRGVRAEDDRASLEYQSLHTADDLIMSQVLRNIWKVQNKLKSTIDRKATVRGVLPTDTFDKAVRSFFQGSLVTQGEQTNPLEMISGARKTTIMGEGGIQSDHAITDESKLINPSHLGFLDPIHTPECFSPESEVFTKTGWKGWPQVTDQDELACRIDGRLEFHRPERLIAEPYKGPMYGLEAARVSYLVTPNHRLYVRPFHGRKWKMVTAAEAHAGQWRFTSTHDPARGDGQVHFTLPEVQGALKDFGTIDIKTWCEFLGWFLSEGNVTYDETKSAYLTVISQTKEEYLQEIEDVLTRLGASWTYSGHGYAFGGKALAAYLSQFGKSFEKWIPDEVYNAPPEAREAFLNAMLHGDGRVRSVRKTGVSYSQRVFTSSSAALADGFERVAILQGYAVTRATYPDSREERYHDIHEVRILRHSEWQASEKSGRNPAKYSVADYDGMVYCAVVPGGMLLVRTPTDSRKVAWWSGNSEKTGVSLSLPLASGKRGNDIVSTFFDARSGRRATIDAGLALRSTVAFPDQYEIKGSKLKPRSKTVRATKNGEIVNVSPKDVDYVIPSARAMFGVSSNLIPFLQNNQGNRAMTAARQQEQAVPLEYREAPLVQVKTDRETSFEEVLGNVSARKSPVEGTVVEVKKDAVVVKDAKGKLHEVQFYRDFGLKGDSLYDSDVKVKEGDKVKKGQLVADSTFTRDGVLALGTNLRAAYVPYFGYNFEDGIVISDAAAKKLTSLHMHQEDILHDKETVIIDRKKFLAQYSSSYKASQLKSVGDDGVVKVGATVREGDPLILALKKPDLTSERKQINEFRRGRKDKLRDVSVSWEKPYEGVVTDVVQREGRIVVYVKTKEPAQVGDKLVGRHGNKGVITRVVPQEQMPYSTDVKSGDKKYVDIALNPLGVPGRINLGQVLETAVSKVAEKDGKSIKVRNFEPGKNYLEDVKKQLSNAGLKDKEPLFDPRTGKPMEQDVLFGDQYILKLKHRATKKLAARSGGTSMPYDINHAPAGGSPHGGQTLGELGMYSLLAHGARENLYEMFAYKSNENVELWDALREGTPLPPPKVPFAFNKFLAYMNGVRLNVRKEGNMLQLVPFTEEQVKALSSGEIKEPSLVVRGKDLSELENGLFDPAVTGGIKGTRWSHFKLPEPMPNPLFEEAIKKLTDITDQKYRKLITGEQEYKGARGGPAFQKMLEDIDVKKEITTINRKLETAKGAGRDKLYKKLKILRALDSQSLKPTVYMMDSVPVMPPVFRPVTVKKDGSISTDDLNGLYKDIGALIEGYSDLKKWHIPESDQSFVDSRRDIYDGLKAMTGLGGSLTREYRGIIDIISGKTRTPGGGSRGSSKTGFFQNSLMKRRQDFTGRSIIIPEPKMGLDELGVPEDIAWEMYKPFVQREMVAKQGYIPADAIDEIKKRSPAARRALERAVEDRPVFLKRDPSLHKYNVMAFKPRIVSGKAIEIHPLVTSGFNADFDGDTMALYLPITEKAVKEAQKMMPSNNLFSATSGAVMYTPGHEALLGMYLLSQPGQRTSHKFKTTAEAKSAERAGKLKKTDIIRVGGHETTVGRILLDEAVPERFRETGKKGVNKMTVFDAKASKKLLTDVAKKDPSAYGDVANKLKDLGNDYSTEIGFSIGLNDFTTINVAERDNMLRDAEKKAVKIRKETGLSTVEKQQKIITEFQRVDKELDKLNDEALKKNPTNIYKMVVSGSRGKPEQLKQIVSTPTLVQDASGRTVPFLIPRSYSEGMDTASYWTSLHGARKGTIQKTQGVREPGALSKLIINSTMSQLITEDDCNTTEGVWMGIDDPDLLDRYVAANTRLGTRRYRAGNLITPDLVSAARKGKTDKVLVRSAMRCKAANGICRKCAGLNENGRPHDIGTNVGVIAGQAIGEPSTQLSLNVFHTGGLAKGGGAASLSTFDRMKQILRLPKEIPHEAPLSRLSGKVTKIDKAPQGGSIVQVNGMQHYVPELQTLAFKVGDSVGRGDSLTLDGTVNPKQLLPLKGIGAVQDYLSSQIHGVLKTSAPVRKRNVEVVVKAMTNVSRVSDSGGHPDWAPGDLRPTSQIEDWNRKNRSKPVKYTPILKGVDVLPKEVEEDWIARMNFQDLGRTLQQAAREGWRSNIHGFHPVPALANATEFGKGKERLGDKWRGEY